MDKRMQEIKEKVQSGQRLSRDDGIYLYQSHDLLTIGELARQKKIEKSQQRIFFNVNHHINLTNVCLSRCKFCAFGVGQDDENAYLMTADYAFEYAARAVNRGITEFHIVSAIHPEMPFSYYVDIIDSLHNAFPDIHIQAFTGVEIFHFAKISGLSIREVLQTLIDAGLGSIPGGGAEILDDDLRNKLCPRKAMSQEWLDVHRTAHEMGLKTNCTMLFGHVETIEQRIDHLISLRNVQDEVPGFQAFIPLPFLPENTHMEDIKRTTAVDDIKTIAISRLMLDNIDHIKAFWIMLGMEEAQIALHFGADDLDGTIYEERIMHAAGATTELGISKDEILRIIREAGYIPTERDTVYNIIKEY